MINTKYIKFLVFLTISHISFSQKQFPIKTFLRNTSNTKINAATALYNIDKPIIIEFWATYCAPCIDLLNSYKSVYKKWQKDYGVKIVVISIEPRIKKKRAIKMIQENEWPFNFYFDYNQDLYSKMTNLNIVPQTLIYDKKFNIIGKFKGIKPNYGYKLINGKVSNEKIKIKNNKFSNLDCDLTDYENVLEFITSKN